MTRNANDDYVRKLSSFIRNNEHSLSQSTVTRRRRNNAGPTSDRSSTFVSWFTPARNTAVFSIDSDKLYYLLIRFEELRLNVGPTDIRPKSPLTRPLFNDQKQDDSDAMSISSFRSSISAISRLSLPISALFYQQPPIQKELKYLFSSFTKLPSLSIHSSSPKSMERQEAIFCVPLDGFKCLENLELVDCDPKRIIGWDQASQSLRIFTMRRCAIEDITSVLVDAVVDDHARREKMRFNQTDTIHEVEDEIMTPPDELMQLPDPPGTSQQLPQYAWSILLALSIPQTGLTFIPTLPPLPSLTHLDLSSNLLISIPPTLCSLTSLIHLNLSDNMIESVLNASSCVVAITFLNISKNRIESCAGLDKIMALENIDLRDNNIEEADEVGRLSAIATLKTVYAEGNPMEDDWRIRCFNRFYGDGVQILLDGTGPSMLERRYLTLIPEDVHVSQDSHHDLKTKSPEPTTVSPPMDRQSSKHSPPLSSSSAPSSPPAGAGVPRVRPKKRVKRIVRLGGEGSESTFQSVATAMESEVSKPPTIEVITSNPDNPTHGPLVPAPAPQVSNPTAADPPHRSPRKHARGHARHATDVQTHVSPSSTIDKTGSQFGTHSRRSQRAGVSVHDIFQPLSPEPDAASADEFRARMEALRKETGEDWLRVLAQREATRPI